jgi:hypothetical protein
MDRISIELSARLELIGDGDALRGARAAAGRAAKHATGRGWSTCNPADIDAAALYILAYEIMSARGVSADVAILDAAQKLISRTAYRAARDMLSVSLDARESTDDDGPQALQIPDARDDIAIFEELDAIRAACITEQEIRIVELAAAGFTAAEIARELETSPATISRRLKAIRRRYRQEGGGPL